MNKKHFNIPVFIPEAACPFRCIYCNQPTISGQVQVPDDDEIIRIIETRLQTLPRQNSVIELAYFGGNFTGFSLEVQRHYLSLIQPYIAAGLISGIRLSTRPDYITPEILALLGAHHVTTIELGAQSLNDEVLSESKRGHSASDTIKASDMILQAGFNLGLQMMIGLPGDSFEKATQTAHKIIALGATETRIYPTLVIKGTLLEKQYREGSYVPLPLAEAVQWTANLMKIFEQAQTTILKVGLHPSEGLLSGSDLIAGPWHPSFRELVLTEIWRELLQPLTQLRFDSILIEVPEKEINYATGYRGSNKKTLLSHFRQVKFRTNARLKGRAFRYAELSLPGALTE